MKRMWSKNELKNIANAQVQEQSSSGELENVKVFEEIIDKDGHKRFIEGDLELDESVPEGITKTYGKWSLSGSHLLIVLCLTAEDTTELSGSQVLTTINLPKWIVDKLSVIFDSISYVDTKNIIWYGAGWLAQNGLISVRKIGTEPNFEINIRTEVGITFTAKRSCRISFDFLIDNE